MSYFEEGGTLPSPFNIIPTPKSIYYFIGWIKTHLFKRTSLKRLETFENLGVRIFIDICLIHVVTYALYMYSMPVSYYRLKAGGSKRMKSKLHYRVSSLHFIVTKLIFNIRPRIKKGQVK